MGLAATAAANLRSLRVARNLTKRALATAAGLEESFYGKVEREDRNATLDGYEALAKALGLRRAEHLFVPGYAQHAHAVPKSGRHDHVEPKHGPTVRARRARAEGPRKAG